jgi:hypothetical protein
MKSLRSIFTIILILTLITAQVGATCPATWNDPNLTCIVTQNWHDFVNNWTYWNMSTWSNFNNYATILLLNSVNQSQTNNLTSVNNTIQGQISTLATTSFVNAVNQTQSANLSAVNTSIRSLFPNYLPLAGGTMTGQINAGGFNISNVLSPVVSTDAATKGYVDSHATPPSPNTVFSALSASQNGNITIWNGTSARWLNDSGYTIPSLIAAVPIYNSSYATTSSLSNYLPKSGGIMTGQINAGGYNLSNVSSPVSSGDVVNLNYFNTHSTGGSGTVSNTSLSTANNITIFSDATGRNISDSSVNYTTVLTNSNYRTKLTTATTYYVATTGSDTTGTGTVGNPWATIQHAYNYVVANDDLGGQTVSIQLAAGTYTSGLSVTQPWTGGGSITVTGATSTASSYIVQSSGGTCFYITTTLPGILIIQNLTINTANYGIFNSGTGQVSFTNIVFGAVTYYHICTQSPGAIVWGNSATYTISGGAWDHIFNSGGLVNTAGATVTLTGTPAFSQSYITILGPYYAAMQSSTYSGSATGQRYNIILNGAAYTNGATLPGSINGTVATGGQYS